ncbi:hypothetical protein N825_12960 [Skermanella stibiiresistens SB22]|uniref:Uncharacterized protein n=2 Tax=Skermanella TaxID=204447 RepID=W9GX66_9PROT|nr:hypothetical protein N825_12960 [Skermanella stibiiresistens SB22]
MVYVDVAHVTRRTMEDLADERRRSLTLGRSVTAAAVERILGIPLAKPASTPA